MSIICSFTTVGIPDVVRVQGLYPACYNSLSPPCAELNTCQIQFAEFLCCVIHELHIDSELLYFNSNFLIPMAVLVVP